MRVDTGQVCRAVAHAGVDLGGRRWPRLGPVRLVPAVTEEDTRTGARGSTELVEEFSKAGDPCEVETGERETRGSQVDVCIDERGCHPGTA